MTDEGLPFAVGHPKAAGPSVIGQHLPSGLLAWMSEEGRGQLDDDKACCSLQNTRFVKSAGPDLQRNQARRHHAPNVPGGEMSEDMIGARSAAAYKLLMGSASAADRQNAQLRGHWAVQAAVALQRMRLRQDQGVPEWSRRP